MCLVARTLDFQECVFGYKSSEILRPLGEKKIVKWDITGGVIINDCLEKNTHEIVDLC